ncbi:hypothetical protein GCM10027435_29810 [Haloparvum alkalitolerans]|uniref:hypothetical protein n=1 Tax=Haloparvum alkalitolerans TaxID=1042953 RepID=UPI003CF9BD6A
MFEADPITMVTFAQDAANFVAQAGPPSELPGPVPDFVGDILETVGSSAGDAKDGFGEAIRDLTPGGSDAAEGANSAGK